MPRLAHALSPSPEGPFLECDLMVTWSGRGRFASDRLGFISDNYQFNIDLFAWHLNTQPQSYPGLTRSTSPFPSHGRSALNRTKGRFADNPFQSAAAHRISIAPSAG